MKTIERKIIALLVSFLLGVTTSAVGLSLANQVGPAPIVITPASLPTVAPTTTPAPPAPLRIYVSGQVVEAAVYELEPGSIVQDAIERAGGFTAEAAAERVNLAQPLADGMQLYVPAQDEIESPPPVVSEPTPAVLPVTDSPPAAAAGLVNINRANQQELETLPRIGPSTAQKIIDHRDANGPFATIEEIMDVSGIGQATFEGLRELITVDE